MLYHFVSELFQPSALLLYWFCLAGFFGFFLWSIYVATQDGINRLRRLHQIPCHRCAFFTGDYRLKCTVHPTTALSEEALNCRDFESPSCPAISSNRCHQTSLGKFSYRYLKKRYQ